MDENARRFVRSKKRSKYENMVLFKDVGFDEESASPAKSTMINYTAIDFVAPSLSLCFSTSEFGPGRAPTINNCAIVLQTVTRTSPKSWSSIDGSWPICP